LSNEDKALSAVRARLRLLRLPLAPTAVADVSAGYLCVRALDGRPVEAGPFALLAGAALCFYGGGMTLNDAFDAERDRALHPERPIPSGAVSRESAFAQGALLLAAGMGLAALAGPPHGLIAVALAVAILLYDGLLKRLAIPGALAMGLCRYLDVQLGAGFAAGAKFPPAALLGAYIVGVTFISTLEERPDDAPKLRAAVYGLLFLLFGGGMLMPYPMAAAWALAPAAFLVALLGMRAVHLGTRDAVKRLVLALLLAIFLVDAGSLAGHRLYAWGVGAAALGLAFPLLARIASVRMTPRTKPEAERWGKRERSGSSS